MPISAYISTNEFNNKTMAWAWTIKVMLGKDGPYLLNRHRKEITESHELPQKFTVKPRFGDINLSWFLGKASPCVCYSESFHYSLSITILSHGSQDRHKLCLQASLRSNKRIHIPPQTMQIDKLSAAINISMWESGVSVDRNNATQGNSCSLRFTRRTDRVLLRDRWSKEMLS